MPASTNAGIDLGTALDIALGSDALARLNALPEDDASALFKRCSHSAHWTCHMLERRPFADVATLVQAAHDAWLSASHDDWHEAFAAHPKIGDVEYLRRRYDTRAMGEQGQVLAAPEAVLEALAQLNRDYEARHGFIFIICASGLGAAQMLEALRARIHRPTDIEFAEAARQHAAINRLRLEQALEQTGQALAQAEGAPAP